MTRTSSKLALATLILILPAVLVAALAGPAYGLVALLVGALVIGGLAAGGVVATAGDGAPFSEDDTTPAGDTPEHSRHSSAAASAR